MSDSSVTPRTVAHQACLSMGFPRQEYWSELPFPTPGDLPDPGVEPGSPALQADSLPLEPPANYSYISDYVLLIFLHFLTCLKTFTPDPPHLPYPSSLLLRQYTVKSVDSDKAVMV